MSMETMKRFLWEVMNYLGRQGPVFLTTEEGVIKVSAPCSCGREFCGDWLELKDDTVTWFRAWGAPGHYDLWRFRENTVEYLGTEEEDRLPPVLPE